MPPNCVAPLPHTSISFADFSGFEQLSSSTSRSSHSSSGNLRTYRRISKEELFIGALLAQGATADVHTGIYRGDVVVVKRTKQSLISSPTVASEFAKEIEQEAVFLSTLRHPAIVRCEGLCFVDDSIPLLVLEKAVGVQLSTYLSSRRKPLSLEMAVSLALQLAEAIKYLHDHNICHRDIKGQNIIVDTATGTLKLIDFGLAKVIQNDCYMTPRTGSYRWASPENLRGEAYDLSSDVYSFGIILWQLVTGRYPYPNCTGEEAGAMVAYNGARPNRLNVSRDCPQALCDLTHACWAEEPTNRPMMEGVVKILRSLLQSVESVEPQPRRSSVTKKAQRTWNRICSFVSACRDSPAPNVTTAFA